MTETAIRVLLVDDHLVVRAGLRQVLGTLPGLAVVGEAESGEEALYLCSKTMPDIIVMDVKMAGMGGVGATSAIRSAYPATRILALSTEANPAFISDMMAAGANGFLLKSCSASDLESAIHRAMAGETVLDPVLQMLTTPVAAATDNIELGPQQRKVLALLVKGFTNAEIADRLNISIPTARYHVSALLVKLGASNRAEAAAMAVHDKLVHSEDY